ncbi:recombinase RecA [Pedosphaera parvula]|uniref:Protein RecA n=1 Tax=Pedosphaera parvula (strain Ellin514) TaxID=320771 RepID=B9XF42_PEDPL|nr:recombinase RecA [Pedosphaera parvula]EEF61540.1 recA protein [Pedosphaera parvula Ellin514]
MATKTTEKSDKVEKTVKAASERSAEKPDKAERVAKADGAEATARVISPTRQRDLEAALSTIIKSYGEGSIMRLGEANAHQAIEVIPTGALGLDLALGVGGLPRGRVVEIYGPESSGKTTLMLHVIANAQKMGGLAAFIDAEHALDPGYAKKLGVNLDDLLVSQPDCGEEALTICETLARSNALDVIVIDSVAALVPKAELEGEMGMATMGMQARLMSQGLRKLTAILNKSKTTCVFTNQLREKVGVMFGNPETTPGGKALKFYASVRLDIRRKDTLKDAAGNAIGNHVKVKVVKNKVAPPFSETEFDIIYNHGINKEGSILDVGIENGVVDKKGAWLQFAGDLIGQGKEAAQRALAEKPELAKKIVEAIMAKRSGVTTEAAKPEVAKAA